MYESFEDLCNYNFRERSRPKTSFLLLGNLHHVVIRSTSRDTDILIHKHRITINSISAKRRNVWFGIIELTEECCLVLVAINAFSGNDYISYLLAFS